MTPPPTLAAEVDELDQALLRLQAAKPDRLSQLQNQVFRCADDLLATPEGLRALCERAHTFDEVGVFKGGPWVNPKMLLPALVRGGLEGPGVSPIVECLSELRLLAVARGQGQSDQLSPEAAREFLQDVLALNLDVLFPDKSEESRIREWPFREKCERLFQLLADELSLRELRRVVQREIAQICIQRPIETGRARRMIHLVDRVPASSEDERESLESLEPFVQAVSGASELARAHPRLVDYRRVLQGSSLAALEAEATVFGRVMRETGLTSAHHAVLLRRLRVDAPELVPIALRLNPVGVAELDQNRELAHQLLRVAVLPATERAVYGFAGVLERGLLSRDEVAGGLRRLVDLDLCLRAKRMLLRRHGRKDGTTANSVLVAGALSVLGQPLGIGQGANPTCQAARGMSLWSQHAPGFLLEIIASAARDDQVQLRTEGGLINSKELTGGLAAEIDPDLDPVSRILVPHLDRIYDELMRRVSTRDEDGHKWVNPAMYGRWVPHGFAAVLDKPSGRVVDYDEFVRRFYATHHPAYNDGHELIYPNPVGIFVTTNKGSLLGLHAVSIQRIREDEDGMLRVYFYNPNNDGRQDWGQGITPSISGHGEREGESSLPFFQFTARLYAFHYNPFEEGDAFAVGQETIDEVDALARTSWGLSYIWVA